MQLNCKETYAMTIDGFTLTRICELKMEKKFCSVAMKCDSVLCCRMSPSQKALVKWHLWFSYLFLFIYNFEIYWLLLLKDCPPSEA